MIPQLGGEGAATGTARGLLRGRLTAGQHVALQPAPRRPADDRGRLSVTPRPCVSLRPARAQLDPVKPGPAWSSWARSTRTAGPNFPGRPSVRQAACNHTIIVPPGASNAGKTTLLAAGWPRRYRPGRGGSATSETEYELFPARDAAAIRTWIAFRGQGGETPRGRGPVISLHD